jgi:hypothetical protein
VDSRRFVLTTIGKGMVAMLETPANEVAQRGEYPLSNACVQKNLDSGTFVDMTENVPSAIGKVYILVSDLA